ncbi:hypothetical protein O181_093269 [Austropuccinia psidii MF-1]|uniref:Uncharacterized protein n=1 Tax=Austropuccinia psidii MF-1 TaxID=1389203 RepID=A0A9Q3J147_9BASI|nr:hypothetical protein [Austropuccinia psidii MF-1]
MKGQKTFCGRQGFLRSWEFQYQSLYNSSGTIREQSPWQRILKLTKDQTVGNQDQSQFDRQSATPTLYECHDSQS